MNCLDVGVPLIQNNLTFNDLVVKNIPLGLLVIDHKGIVISFNHILQKLTGIDSNKVIGKPYKSIFLYNNQTIPTNNELQLTLLTGFNYENISLDRILPVKYLENVDAATHAIWDNNKTIVGAMAIICKLKHLKDLEQTLIHAEKLAILGQLAANAFHEVKNQLTVADGFLQMLTQKYAGMQYINIINESFQHISNIINDFLYLAKPGCKQWKPCNIFELIDQTINLVQGGFIEYGLEIKNEISPGLPDLRINPEQIKQVLINIVKNGLEAMPDGGQLVIKAAVNPEKNTLNIDIIDSGKGMSEETKNSLFKPFYTTKENGTGLGLYVSQQIISNHGGKMNINSQFNQVTTVTIELPLQENV